MKEIRIILSGNEFSAEINDSPTAQLIYEHLPFEATVNTWGEEIYFSIPLTCKLEPDAREILEPGELAFWPVGSAFCLFFGPTPASSDKQPRAYSPVNVFGRLKSDLSSLKQIRHGSAIRVEQ